MFMLVRESININESIKHLPGRKGEDVYKNGEWDPFNLFFSTSWFSDEIETNDLSDYANSARELLETHNIPKKYAIVIPFQKENNPEKIFKFTKLQKNRDYFIIRDEEYEEYAIIFDVRKLNNYKEIIANNPMIYEVYESIKHLPGRTEQELQNIFINTIKEFNNSLENFNIKDNPEFDKIAKLFKTPKKDLYLISEFNNRYDYSQIDELFKSSIEYDKPVKILVKETNMYYGGVWLCYPEKLLAYWICNDFDSPHGWIFSKKRVLNKLKASKNVNESIKHLPGRTEQELEEMRKKDIREVGRILKKAKPVSTSRDFDISTLKRLCSEIDASLERLYLLKRINNEDAFVKLNRFIFDIYDDWPYSAKGVIERTSFNHNRIIYNRYTKTAENAMRTWLIFDKEHLRKLILKYLDK